MSPKSVEWTALLLVFTCMNAISNAVHSTDLGLATLLVSSFQQKPPPPFLGIRYLRHFPAFIIKCIQPVDEAVKVEMVAGFIGYIFFPCIGLAVINGKCAAAVGAKLWVQFDVLARIGGFQFYAFYINLAESEERLCGEKTGEQNFFHGQNDFRTKKKVKKMA